MLFARSRLPSDPFEGSGARRRELRLRVEGILAFAMAIAACGLVAAMWLRLLVPLVERSLAG